MKNINIITLILFLVFPITLMSKPIIESLTVVNGTCRADASITVNISNQGTKVTYGIKGVQNQIAEVTSQISNVFRDLPAGDYIVSVYDETTGSVPVTKSVSVTTSYKTFLLASAKATEQGCSGSIAISVKDGLSPYSYTVINKTTGEKWQKDYAHFNYTFTKLPAGVYECEITDACGETRIAKASPNTTLELKDANTPYDSFDFMLDRSRIYGDGDCNKLRFSLFTSDFKINGNTNFVRNGNTLARLVYPHDSDTTNLPWTSSLNGYFYTSNYNIENPGKYRVEIKNPCTGAILSSPSYIMPTATLDFSCSFNGFVYNNFCDLPELCALYLNLKTSGITNYVCGGYYVEVISKVSGDIKTYAWTGSYLYLTELKVDTDYIVKIYKDSSKTTLLKTLNSRTNKPTTPPTSTFSDMASYGANFGTKCDFETGAITANYSYPFSSYSINLTNPITFSIVSGPVQRDPITIKSGSRGDLWDDLPFGTYTIETNYNGCRTTTTNFELKKQVYGFDAKTPTIKTTGICGNYDVSFQGYFKNLLNNPISGAGAGRYDVVCTNMETQAVLSSTFIYSNYTSTISLPSGRYKVRYYSYYDRNRSCPYKEEIIDLPIYMPPTINLPLSGGITCGAENGNLTIDVAEAGRPPLVFRYKAYDAPDSEYVPWQESNKFSGLQPGRYLANILDDCGSVTKQALKIFSGSEQFVELLGSFDGNTICQGQTGVVSVLSIGPVEWYQWYKDGIKIEGATAERYEITNMQAEDAGKYKVVISTGLCELNSEIKVSVVPVLTVVNDSLTVFPYEQLDFDIFENDLFAECAPNGGEQLLTPDKLQIEGYPEGVLEGDFGKMEIVNNKIRYTAPEEYSKGIVNFTYKVSCEIGDVEYSDLGRGSIYILQSCKQATVCYNEDFEVCFYDYPTGTKFYVLDDGTPINIPKTYSNMKIDKILNVTPVIGVDSFPNRNFTIKVIPESGAKIRWKGMRDHYWNNPYNWILVNADGTDGDSISWAPSYCVDAEIPTQSPKYPKLHTQGDINNLYLKDRAMLGYNHRLRYNSVSMELKLTTEERNHWLMYSAPILNMYSGDFMLLQSLNTPIKEGVYMTFFQSRNTDDAVDAKVNTIIRTCGNLEKTLDISTPFFLKIDASKDNSSYYQFPRSENKYTYYSMNNWSNAHPTTLETEPLTRNSKGRFVTDGLSSTADGSFSITFSNDMIDSKVIMVSNPFPAYLNIKKFLETNTLELEQGFKIWDGTESSFMKYNAGRGNTWTIEDINQIKSSNPIETDYIAPFQSFFVIKKSDNTTVNLHFNPEDMTTVEPIGITGDYKLK